MRSKINYSLAKISQELGVSKATVSLVLNGKARQHGISKQMEQRIQEFCRDVNYRPNIHAQRLNRPLANNIGILLEERIHPEENTPLGDYNVSHILGGIALAADRTGYRFTVQIFRSDMDENQIFDWFNNREIDGLIYYGFDMPRHWRERFRDEQRKVVGISIDPAQGMPCVNVDNFSGTAALTEHLIDMGRKKMLYLNGPVASYPGRERLRGFLAALEKHHLSGTETIRNAGYSVSEAEDIVTQLFSQQHTFDAVVCANDDMAIGAMRALHSMAMNIPQQVAVTGADNIRSAGFVYPALTTFDYLPEQLGNAAFELLYKIIDSPAANTDNVTIPAEIILRNSG